MKQAYDDACFGYKETGNLMKPKETQTLFQAALTLLPLGTDTTGNVRFNFFFWLSEGNR